MAEHILTVDQINALSELDAALRSAEDCTFTVALKAREARIYAGAVMAAELQIRPEQVSKILGDHKPIWPTDIEWEPMIALVYGFAGVTREAR